MTKKTAGEIPLGKSSLSLAKLFRDKAREARLSLQANPDGLPWPNNKVVKERHVGKRKEL